MKRKPTTNDIANTLGLSRTTVSRAMNGHPDIPEATKQAVRAAAEKLGYRSYKWNMSPLHAEEARTEPALGTERGKTIAFLIRYGMDISSDGYWMDVLRGVEEGARLNGCHMTVSFIPEKDLEENRLPSLLHTSSVDGIIVAGATTRAYLRSVCELGIPTVTIDCHPDLYNEELLCDVVLMESELAVYSLTSQLIRLGHQQIGFIGDVHNCRSFHERWIGFRRAMTDAGLTWSPSQCLTDLKSHQYYDTQELSGALEQLDSLPTAFVCGNDLVAARCIAYLNARGFRVPEDVSVTGFDYTYLYQDIPRSEAPLQTVEVFASRIGIRAFEQWLWRSRHPKDAAEQLRIACTIVEGKSIGPVRA